MASSSHGVASMPARTMSGPSDQGESGDDAAEAAGVGEHGRQATGGFVTRRRPPRRFASPARGTRRSSARPTKARRAPVRWRHRATEPRPDHRPRDRAPDRACSACSRRWRATTPTAGWSPRAVNGAAVALRRRSPLGALAAVVIAQALAHDATYDTDPLSPFLAELILMFTVAYELRFGPRSPASASGSPTSSIDFGSGRIEEIAQAGAQCGFYLLAWASGASARPRGAPRGRRAPRRARRARARGAGAHRGRRRARADRARAARRRRPQRVRDGPAGGRACAALLGDDPAASASARRWPASRRPAARRSASCTACSASCASATPAPSSRRSRRCGASTSSSTQVRAAGLDATLDVDGEPAELAAGPRHVRVPDRAGGADQRAALRARLDASA